MKKKIAKKIKEKAVRDSFGLNPAQYKSLYKKYKKEWKAAIKNKLM